MAFSELLHAWELLKKGGSGGILVGLGVGLWVEKFPVMPVLYGLSQRNWSVVAVQGQRITYEVPDLLIGSDKLKTYELDLVPLVICGLVFCVIGMYMAERSTRRRANSQTPSPTKPRANGETQTEQGQHQSERGE